jgi:hypothetical protein
VRQRLTENGAFPMDQYLSEQVTALGALPVDGLNTCIAALLTETNPQITITPRQFLIRYLTAMSLD